MWVGCKMSGEVVKGFFPVLVPLAESNPRLRNILNSFFPQRVAEICPTPVGVAKLKWPTVAIACIIGCLLGFASGGHLLLRASAGKRAQRGFFAWGFAFLWYGLMCAGGLFYHCIRPAPLFYNADVVGTACSSISVVAGSTLADDTAYPWRGFLVACYVGVTVLAVCGGQMVRELLYLVPTTVAFLRGAWYVGGLLSSAQPKSLRKWVAAAAVGGAVGLGGVACDRWLCLLLGPNFSMLFFFFWGCNLAIFALFPVVSAWPSGKRPHLIEGKDS